MSNKFKRRINLRKHFKNMFTCKKMFDLSVEDKNVGNALFWSKHIKFWRNEIKGLQDAN